jgi:hypothetical protein
MVLEVKIRRCGACLHVKVGTYSLVCTSWGAICMQNSPWPAMLLPDPGLELLTVVSRSALHLPAGVHDTQTAAQPRMSFTHRDSVVQAGLRTLTPSVTRWCKGHSHNRHMQISSMMLWPLTRAENSKPAKRDKVHKSIDASGWNEMRIAYTLARPGRAARPHYGTLAHLSCCQVLPHENQKLRPLLPAAACWDGHGRRGGRGLLRMAKRKPTYWNH